MHTSSGLTAAGRLCPLGSAAWRCNSSLCWHFLRIFETHGREEVQDTQHCSWLSNSVRIIPPLENTPQSGRAKWDGFDLRTWFVSLTTMFMSEMQSKFFLVLPTQHWMSKESRDTLLAWIEKKKSIRVSCLFNRCYSTASEVFHTLLFLPNPSSLVLQSVCSASKFCCSGKVKLSVCNKLSEIWFLKSVMNLFRV